MTDITCIYVCILLLNCLVQLIFIFAQFNFEVATIVAAMASRHSPRVPYTPPRCIQQDCTSSPDISLYGKERDAISSASESQTPPYQEPPNTRPQSAQTLPQPSFEKTSRSERPKKPRKQRSSLTNGSQFTPDGNSKAGAEATNDDPNPILDLQKNKVPSPCGKKSYITPGGLQRHKYWCVDCQEKTQAQEICDTALGSKRQPVLEHKGVCAAEAADEQLGGKASMIPRVTHETLGGFGLDHGGKPSIHGADDKTHGDPDPQPSYERYSNGIVPRIADEMLNASSPRSAEKKSPKANGAVGLVRIRSATLDLENEANLEETPMPFSAALQITASKLHSKLRELLESQLTDGDKEGYIYIFFDPKRPKLHKIGKSIKPNRRLGQTEYTCGLELNLVKEAYVNYYTRTEGLIHTYLSDLRRPYKCDICGESHGEWFEIADASARASVNFWVNFMTQEYPYDPESRQLQPFIGSLVKIRENLFADVEIKLETVREHWNQILSPTSLDRFQFKFNIIWEVFWKFYWQVSAMSAWTVAFVVSKHPVSFMFMAASVIGTFISMSNEYDRLRSFTMSPKKRRALKGLHF